VEWDDIVMSGLFAGVIAAFFWPGAVVFFLARRFIAPKDPERFARVVGGESAEDKMKRFEKERAEQARHIERLERELEIGPFRNEEATHGW
jgi:hypothetical protein